MSIFAIIGIVMFIVCIFTILPVGLSTIASYDDDEVINKRWRIGIILFIFLTVGLTCAGIGLATEHEKIWVEKYEAQKQTIEMSLESDELSGYERIQLVTKATELNGELAEKKASFDLWHTVYYDNTIYDNVEPINFN